MLKFFRKKRKVHIGYLPGSSIDLDAEHPRNIRYERGIHELKKDIDEHKYRKALLVVSSVSLLILLIIMFLVVILAGFEYKGFAKLVTPHTTVGSFTVAVTALTFGLKYLFQYRGKDD